MSIETIGLIALGIAIGVAIIWFRQAQKEYKEAEALLADKPEPTPAGQGGPGPIDPK